jgi:hypothetical protein
MCGKIEFVLVVSGELQCIEEGRFNLWNPETWLPSHFY